MGDAKKFHAWIKGMLHWPEEVPQKPVKRTRYRQRSRERYYVGESYPGVYLTTREFEVARLLLKHYRYKEVAETLGLSHRSVEFYVQHMREKFECDNKSALVAVLATMNFPVD